MAPRAPPRAESKTASASSCLRTCHRLEPMASRIANSRLRSAVRAEKRLARFAHAASNTRNASSIIPARNDRAGSPSMSPIKPGFVSLALKPSSAGSCPAIWVAIALRLSVACCGVTSGFSLPTTQRLCDPRHERKSDPSLSGLSTMGIQKSGHRNASIP